MRLYSLELYKLTHRSRTAHAFARKNAYCFISKRSTGFFNTFIKNRRFNLPNRYFRITESSQKRIANVPVDKLTGQQLSGLKSRLNETGLVYFDDFNHFAYAIGKSGVYIMTSSKYRTGRILPEKELLYHVGTAMDGFIYIDFMGDKIDWLINNPFDMLFNPNSDDKKYDISLLKIAKNILKEIETYLPGPLKEIDTKMLIDLPNTTLAYKYYNHYMEQYNKVKLCLQAFMFIHFAKVIDTTVVTEYSTKDSPKMAALLGKKLISEKVIVVDTRYDTSIKVINPFSVTGHFRNQACGKDWCDRKLIYIDEFMKIGYTREATKVKEGMNN